MAGRIVAERNVHELPGIVHRRAGPRILHAVASGDRGLPWTLSPDQGHPVFGRVCRGQAEIRTRPTSDLCHGTR